MVLKRGEHHVGDRVIYCEIDSLLPEREEFEFLRNSCFKPAQIDAAGNVAVPAGFAFGRSSCEANTHRESVSPFPWYEMEIVFPSELR